MSLAEMTLSLQREHRFPGAGAGAARCLAAGKILLPLQREAYFFYFFNFFLLFTCLNGVPRRGIIPARPRKAMARQRGRTHV